MLLNFTYVHLTYLNHKGETQVQYRYVNDETNWIWR